MDNGDIVSSNASYIQIMQNGVDASDAIEFVVGECIADVEITRVGTVLLSRYGCSI